uniref:Glycosyltransferase family 1 protein n=1 Tax=candidate division WWE3 bacterium TaxID=2053526 RepID=A0A832E0S0_UNCKA
MLIALTSSQVGGAPKVVYDLLSQIRQKAKETALAVKRAQRVSKRQKVGEFEFVVAAPEGGPFVRKFRDLGYPVYTVSFDKVGLRGFTRLFKIVCQEEIDLINSHGKGAGLYARVVGAITGIRVVQTFHGIHYFRYGKVTRWLYFIFERLMSRFACLIINVSASQQREGIALRLFPREKARVVENGVDFEEIKSSKSKIKNEKERVRKSLGLSPKDFIAVVVARFDLIKGHARLVKVLPLVLAKVPRLKVVFVGGGKEENRVKKLVEDLGVSDAVVFAGRVDNPFPILSSADMLLSPSYHEGLPLSPLEASALSVPVVVSRAVGNVDTVLNGKTGYLIDFDDEAEVVKAIRRLGSSKALRKKMGEKGRKWVAERFSMEKFVRKTLAVYEEALAGKF